ncbi:MAG: hypothetical protein AAF564_07715, partial [Bacteroidota bacterium]
MKKLLVVSIFALFLSTTFILVATGQTVPAKKALAILGDFWHGVAPLDIAIVGQLNKKGYVTDVIPDYDVPFDALSTYDLIVLSRYYIDDYKKLETREPDPRKYGWLTPEEEEAIEAYVLAGGSLFLHHDGIGYYPRDGAIVRLAKAYFVNHPPVVDIAVVPVGAYGGLNENVEPFIIRDEEFRVELDPAETNVFMESYSEANGH